MESLPSFDGCLDAPPLTQQGRARLACAPSPFLDAFSNWSSPMARSRLPEWMQPEDISTPSVGPKKEGQADGHHDLLLAVGVPLGLVFEPGQVPPDIPAAVRRGNRFHRVTAEQYRIWSEAISARSTHELLEWAVSEEINDPERAISMLEDEGLVIRLSGDESARLDILRSHRLYPMGFGLGNSVDSPGIFVIARQDLTPAVQVDGVLYTLWATAIGCTSLWHVCAEVAAELNEPIGNLTDKLLGALPALMGAGVVLLDAV